MVQSDQAHATRYEEKLNTVIEHNNNENKKANKIITRHNAESVHKAKQQFRKQHHTSSHDLIKHTQLATKKCKT